MANQPEIGDEATPAVTPKETIPPLTAEEAEAFFTESFHSRSVFGEVKKFGYGWSCILRNSIASFDFDAMTRLVWLAHKLAIRVEVMGAGQFLKIAVHRRSRGADRLGSRHPTLDEAVAKFEDLRTKDAYRCDLVALEAGNAS